MAKPTLAEQVDGLVAAEFAHDLVLRSLTLAVFDSNAAMRTRLDAALEGLAVIHEEVATDQRAHRILRLAQARIERLLGPIAPSTAPPPTH